MNEPHAFIDLPMVTVINEDETVIAKTVDKILYACWNGFHDYRDRQ